MAEVADSLGRIEIDAMTGLAGLEEPARALSLYGEAIGLLRRVVDFGGPDDSLERLRRAIAEVYLPVLATEPVPDDDLDAIAALR